jgi:hypothetical protein
LSVGFVQMGEVFDARVTFTQRINYNQNCCAARAALAGADSAFTGDEGNQVPSLAIRWTSRETLRLAVFLCITPFCADFMICGSASFMAASA